ncbi:DNA-binding transcriptional regulator, CsgD family [Pseudovibrio denitrificans]|uniref:DNA-binding transcriptional regulator, CsgD family n=1 Tax=Pseudovibrio denitrificans TaxID=258256 RepID=A0A1I7DXY4_9HYPH|nr:helix-turn-helix transcriptional regulator [Pseudovibrio denitrificans]SFU16486.1 DNA-binding transcriptional regulator, CsgD family [Pseudovibrio denitrificans]
MQNLQDTLVKRMYACAALGEDIFSALEPLAHTYPEVLFGVQAQCFCRLKTHHLAFWNCDDGFEQDMREGESVNPFPALMDAAAFDEVIYSERFISPDQVKRSEFYERVLSRQNKCDRSRGIILHRRGTDGAVITATMPERFVGQEDDELCAMLEFIKPSFQSAFALGLELERRRFECDDQLFWLERIPSAAFVLDHGLHVALANQRGEAVLRKGEGVLVDRSVSLSSKCRFHRAHIERSVHMARSTQMPQVPCVLQSEERASMIFAAVPLETLMATQPYLDCFLGEFQPVLCILIDPADLPVTDVQMLQSYLSISLREAELVRCLVGGLSMRETADKMQISYNTARNHLARITEKVGFVSQSELVRFASDLAARIPS